MMTRYPSAAPSRASRAASSGAGVQEGDREGLVAPGVGEGVEPDDADLLDALLGERLELVVELVQRLHSFRDGVEAPELAVEELVESDAFTLAEESAQPPAQERVGPLQPGDPDDEHDDGDPEHQDERGNCLRIEGHSRRSIPGQVSSSSRGKET